MKAYVAVREAPGDPVRRDPRTGVRESHLIDVLREGRIDAFLIAMLRARAASSVVN